MEEGVFKLPRSAQRHGADPQAYFTSVLAKISSTPLSESKQLLPDVWKADSLSQPPRGAASTASQKTGIE